MKLSTESKSDQFESEIDLIRSTEAENERQIASVRSWPQPRDRPAPTWKTAYSYMIEDASGTSKPRDSCALGHLQQTARDRKNMLRALMEALTTYSLGQIDHRLYVVGEE